MTKRISELSRRERQIMDIIYTRGQATAAEVGAELTDAPSYSTVRTLLSILERKGFLKHREEGPRYVFLPTESHQKASQHAIRRVLNTFFEGSLANAVAALMDVSDAKLSPVELERIEVLIRAAKNKSS
jgi:BlaI family penicillinase repressor